MATASSSTTTTTTPLPTISSLAEEILAEVFSFLGSADTARCAQTNTPLYRIARHSRALWRRFVYDDFGLAQGCESADWYSVYRYLVDQKQHYQLQEDSWIESRLVFCDDGSHQPGNDPEHALQRNDLCWCTNAFVDHDVDFVAEFANGMPHLVVALEIANGDARYSAPVKEALGFCSLEVPNLAELAQHYDGARGIHLARQLSENRLGGDNNNHNKKLPRGHPLAGFWFPGIPRAYSARLQKQLLRPTVARYVHFKLLSSSKCINRVSNNIDVCNLFAYGVPLPRLNEMIHSSGSQQLQHPLPPDPSRELARHRKHKVREYPWHIHDAFQVEQEMEFRRQQRLRRLSQMLEENRQHLQHLEELVAEQFPDIPNDNSRRRWRQRREDVEE